jgi:hypothetical protein
MGGVGRRGDGSGGDVLGKGRHGWEAFVAEDGLELLLGGGELDLERGDALGELLLLVEVFLGGRADDAAGGARGEGRARTRGRVWEGSACGTDVDGRGRGRGRGLGR